MKFKDWFVQHRKKIIGIAFFFLLLGLTIYYICREMGAEKTTWSAVFRSLRNAEGEFLLFGILAVFAYLFLQGLCYKSAFVPLGVKIGIFDGFKYASYDFYGAAVTPSATGGQPLVAFFMAQDGIPVYKSTIVLLLQTVVYKIILVILSFCALIYNHNYVFGTNNFLVFLFFFGIIVNIIIIAICIFAMLSNNVIMKWGSSVISFLSKVKLIKNKDATSERFAKWVGEYKTSARFIKNNTIVLIKTVVYTFFQRIAIFCVPYFVYRSLGISGARVFDLLALQIIISVSVDSLPTPGGMGFAERFFKEFFVNVFGAHILMTALLFTRGISYYFSLAFTAIITLVNYIMVQKREKSKFKGN